jgi:cytochrome c biogenesis protein CcdA
METTHKHSKRFHQINRFVFRLAIVFGVFGSFMTATGLALSLQVSSVIIFVGAMAAFFAGRNLVCEKSCTSD